MKSLNPSPIQRLRSRLENTIEQARSNPLFGLPEWVEEIPLPPQTPIVCCGTGHWASAFLHYAKGLDVIAVVDDGFAGREVLGRECINTLGLVELARQRPGIVCVNTGQSDAGYSHFEQVAARYGVRMLNYLQAVRAFGTVPDIRIADWRNTIVERWSEYLSLEPQLVDQLSVETLYGFLLYHLETEREILLAANRPGDTTYFRSGLFGLDDHETYVDCGAYDGDSVRNFMRAAKGNFRAVHAFEPDPANFARLKSWHQSLGAIGEAERISVYPNAVGSTAGSITFNHTGGEGACIPITSEVGQVGIEGGVHVEVVSLDAAITQPISLLKLDVEGHEIEILRGAEAHLRASKPKLAICAYHLPSDLIELPRYVASLDLGYKLGLRHHSNSRYDTVLYAF